MVLISNVSLTKSLPAGERWEGGEEFYNSQCLGLPVLASSSPAEIMGVRSTKNGCRRRRQKEGFQQAPASSNKSVLRKLALFNPKWGTAQSCEPEERCWPACREGTQQQHSSRDFCWAVLSSQVWVCSWIPAEDSFYFWPSSQSPREQLQHTTVFPKHVSGRRPLARPERHAASAGAHLGKN